MRFSDKVLSLAKQIPKGKVSTYKDIALALNTRSFQAVGQALAKNTRPLIIPCHRVIKSNGEVGGYKGKRENTAKIKLLKKEGIKIRNGKVIDLDKVRHYFI